MATTEEKTRVVTFDGNADNWRMWSRKFVAIARKKGWHDILTGVVKITEKVDTLDETSDNGKEAILIRNKNADLYAELILSLEDTVAFDLVDEATTDDLPEGDSALAWRNLKTKYKGTSMTKLTDLKKEFYSTKLKDADDDPDVWISSLEKLRKRLNNDFKCKISEEDLIIQILSNMPQEYDSMTELLSTSLATTGLTLMDLRAFLNAKYKKLQSRKTGDEIDLEEKVLNTVDTKKCKTCGKLGHKAVDCFKDPKNRAKYEAWKKKESGQNRRNNRGGRGYYNQNYTKSLKCYVCGDNHKAWECEKRYKNEDETKSDESEEEISMIAHNAELTEVNERKMSNTKINRLIVVGDSGATSHMGYCDQGMYDVEYCQDKIRVGNNQEAMVIKKEKKCINFFCEKDKRWKVIVLKTISTCQI